MPGGILHACSTCVSLPLSPLQGGRLLTPLDRRSPQMATRPFEPWGREGEEDETKLTEDEREERRLCDLGDAENLGLQCSCSS